MAESKNTFIKSKMNQDLDSRLVPNGEYREAFNISISQSEGADVGTLQTVLGNVKNIDFSSNEYCNAKINGVFVDEQRKDIYVFITNFTDTTSDKLSGYPSDEAICEIWKRNIETEKTIKLVEGKFLNLSLTHPIENVNIIEDLLFWTDNRNQPRKINVIKANPGEVSSPTYYTNDDQINVAKYYPFEPISLIKDYIVDFALNTGTPAGSEYDEYIDEIVPTEGGSGTGLTVKITDAKTSGPGQGEIQAIEIVNQGNGYQDGDVVDIFPRVGDATITLVVQTQSTMKDKCTENLPIAETFAATTPGTTLTNGSPFAFSGLPSPGPPSTLVGALVTIESSSGSGTPYLARVTAHTATTLTINWPNATPASVTLVTGITVGINPDYDANWPGDCEYLKDKFVRFAYRFKFDDNEYSLISPFTQACFIPQQDGFFLKQELTEPDGTSVTEYDSDKAYEDTDVEFFQNKVTDIEFIITCPSFLEDGIENFNNLTEQMHVESIEIIYKDDSEDNLKLLDTITKEDFSGIQSNKLSYSYQSRQPIKVLPEREITRVSDRVPIKALTQEVAGNRVIYGNYVDGYTSVRTLNYEIAATEKLLEENTRIEYQNHTLKQNRTYQVGVVLTDRYGRNSDVILSSLDKETSTSAVTFSGSTIFHPYYGTGFSANELIRTTIPSTGWGGDALRIKFNSKIPDNTGQVGYPGLFRGYVIENISNFSPGDGLYTNPGTTNALTNGGTGTGLTVDYVTLKSTPGTSPMVSVTINNPGSGYTLGDLISIPGRIGGSTDASFIYNPALMPNLTGWYSYKIVVKQQEQDYYNVYLPSIINGSVNKSGDASATEASITLFSDNINKVPKNLTDVGPSQTTFNSDVQLSLRVVNNEGAPSWSSVQYYPDRSIEKVVQLSELSNLGVTVSKISSDVSAGAVPPLTITMAEYNSNIQSGMAILSVVNSGGTTIINEGAGAYAESYYSDGAGGAELIVRGTTTNIPNGSTITFGPPGVVYNGINNPVIGVLSTSDGIGVNANSTTGFKTQLAVAETKPFKSLLDIYYETTSSGLIEELNDAIDQGITTTIPVRISGIVFDLDESDTGTNVCTNDFYLIDSNNTNIISPSTTGNLVSVFDANHNPRTSEFILNPQPSGNFNISMVRVPGEGVYIGQDLNDNIFDFTVSLTNNGITITNTFTGTIGNIKPVYQGVYDGASYNLSKVGAAWGGPNPGDVFECFNGSGDVNLRDKEIRWELIDVIAVDGQNASQPSVYPPDATWPNSNPSTSAWVPYSAQSGGSYDPYQILEGGDYTTRFELVDQDNTSNRSNFSPLLSASKMGFYYKGLQYFGTYTQTIQVPTGPPNALGNQTYGPSSFTQSTAALVNYITFRFRFKAVDRNGSGISAGTITQNITFQ